MRWLKVAFAVLVFALAGTVYARLFAGGPVAMFPGGELRGDVLAPPPDWTFARRVHDVDVESRVEALPYSQRVWFLVHEGRGHLLLPNLFGMLDELRRRLDADPNVRVRVDDIVYEQKAVRVGVEETGDMLAALMRRQFALEISGRVRQAQVPGGAHIWIYRLEDR